MTDKSPLPLHNADGPWAEGRAGLVVIALFFGVFGGWAALAPLDAGVVAQGVVKVSGNRQVVQHREGGVITAIAVHEGDRVKSGQVLLDLAAAELLAQERALANQAIELEAMRARLHAERADAPLAAPAAWTALPLQYKDLAQTVLARQAEERAVRAVALGAQRSVLVQRQALLNERITGYESQIAALDRQTALVSDELTGLRKLADKGLAPLTRVRAVERAESEIVGRRAELASQIAQARESIGETRLQVLALMDKRAEEIAVELRDVDVRTADVAPRLQAARTQLDRTRVRAPADGVVVGLAFFNVGAVVGPGERILDIVPQHEQLIVEARIKPEDADDLRTGQATQVRFSSIDARNVPPASGRVTRVSADRFEDARTGLGYFTADIEITPAELRRIAAAGGRQELKVHAGLPVDVIVKLRKRTALTYLVEPLNQSIWRSFREN